MAKVFDPYVDPTGDLTIICDFSPPRSGDPRDVECPPLNADFILVNSSPGRSVRTDPAMLASYLKTRWDCEVIFALLTRDMNRLAIQSYLLGAQMLGLENVVVAQGDQFGPDKDSVARVNDYRSTELIEAIGEMNLGRDFRGRGLSTPTDFCIGATLDTGEQLDRQVDLSVRKIASGANFLLTQPIFDPELRDNFENVWLETTGYPCPADIYWGLQMLEENSVSFGPVPEGTLTELRAGRSGIDIALELFAKMRSHGVNNIYLLPPIRRGGQRNYSAAQQFIEAARGN